jgi:hypothetical protein
MAVELMDAVDGANRRALRPIKRQERRTNE